jgi:helicase
LIDRRWQVTGYSRTNDTARDVTRIAIDLQRVYKNVLVVATSRDYAEKYAERLAREVSHLDTPLLSGQETKKLQILAQAIRDSIHPNARLAEFVTFGVAYHHARLPANVKSQIEDYIADGTLKLIAATTTLAQGVNFPIRCVVLGSIYFAGNPMGPLDLQNIIGRAGRAGVSTTG